jgi:hypothetical protein
MEIKPSQGERKDDFIGRCISHQVGKGMQQDRAAALCYTKWEDSLKESSLRIMFDKDIPVKVVKHFVDRGYKTFIWGGDGFFNKQKPAFNLAKQSGVNQHNIFWGKLSWVKQNNDIDLFMSRDEMWDMDGFLHYYEDKTIMLAEGDVGVIQERWVTKPEQTAGGKSCPICIELQRIGWVGRDETVQYNYPGGTIDLIGLPPYRKAHSQIGGGKWKVSDYYCKCAKQFRIAPIGLSTPNKKIVTIKECCNHD